MIAVKEVSAFLAEIARLELAEDWDNVGLLVGDPRADVQRIMTCLTVTPASAQEAIDAGANLIVTHHPLPFHPLQRLTTETVAGRLLLDLIAAGVAIYSAHTAFDSAAEGVNQRLAEGLGLCDIRPLREAAMSDAHAPLVGSGRCGTLEPAVTLEDLAGRVKQFLAVDGLHVTGSTLQSIHKVAIACGAGGEFLALAHEQGCDAFVTGEARFHACLEAESLGIGLLLPGHFASERFAVVGLAEALAQRFPTAEIWASRQEADPLRWI